MLTQQADVYQRKAIQSRSRNARIDARLTVEFTARQVALAAKLDAIVKANKAPDGTLQQVIDYGAELQELEDDILDREYHASGAW